MGGKIEERTQEEWARSSGYKEVATRGHPCIHKVKGTKCDHLTCHPPATDHPSLWKKKDGTLVFVSQPYGLGLRDVQELVVYCAKEGLTFSISGDSFHFPGRTFMVMIEKVK